MAREANDLWLALSSAMHHPGYEAEDLRDWLAGLERVVGAQTTGWRGLMAST